MKKYCFGVDVGGTTVKVGLFTVEGQLLDKWEIITRTENNGENILFDICESLEAKLDEKSIDLDEVRESALVCRDLFLMTELYYSVLT